MQSFKDGHWNRQWMVVDLISIPEIYCNQWLISTIAAIYIHIDIQISAEISCCQIITFSLLIHRASRHLYNVYIRLFLDKSLQAFTYAHSLTIVNWLTSNVYNGHSMQPLSGLLPDK